MSGKAMAMKSLKEKWLSMVQLARENGENGIGGSSTITVTPLTALTRKNQTWTWVLQYEVMALFFLSYIYRL